MTNEEASPICRGKNLSWETILLFYNNMPREAMPKAKFHSFLESKINGWTQTHSQIARQLAFYYEKEGICYPRFTATTKYVDLFSYVQNWATKYFIPNPYTPSLRSYNPVCIYSHLKRCISEGLTDFDEALDSMFDVTLNSHDKVNVYLSNFTDIVIDSNHKMSDSDEISEEQDTKEIGGSLATDIVEYYNYFNLEAIKEKHTKQKISDGLHLQQIFYGAPGTGKSHEIDKMTNENNRIRTTFHPDYDYATFVGCYKPTKENVGKKLNTNLSFQDLANILNGYYNDPSIGHVLGLQKFVYEYLPYLNGDIMSVNVNQLIQKAGISENYSVEINKYVKFCKLLPQKEESKITYKFIPQSFTKAYVEAWRRFADSNRQDKDYFLVIEEINRGNCAQIFGDLFQLLDRTSRGYSSYAVEADTDLQQFLATDEEWRLNITLTEDITNDEGRIIAKAEDVMSGKVLVIPPNLHIWATMNTSDQSLFPIDSAFKRRWDWTYVPIKYNNKAWKVVLSDKYWCSWKELQTKLNDLIYDATESEDKMLGDWFVKANDKNVITEEQLVGKIIFYLWNDVAKVNPGTLFDLEVEKRGRKRNVIFSDFYTLEEKTDTAIVNDWLTKIGVTTHKLVTEGKEEDYSGSETNRESAAEVQDPETDDLNRRSNHKYILNVLFNNKTFDFTQNKKQTYLELLQEIGLDRIEPILNRQPLPYHRKGMPLVTKNTPTSVNDYSKVGEFFVMADTIDDTKIPVLNLLNSELNLNLTINLKK